MFDSQEKKNQLVTLHPGKYWKVDELAVGNGDSVVLKRPTNALLLELQGRHKDSSECWHALVNGQVILVWESSFSKGA